MEDEQSVLERHCTLCYNPPLYGYVETKGGLHTLCASCIAVLHKAGLLVGGYVHRVSDPTHCWAPAVYDVALIGSPYPIGKV